MSIAKDSKILWSDIKSLYDRLRSEQSRRGISQTAIQGAQNSTAKATDITTLINALEAMSSNSQVGSNASVSGTDPVRGALISPTILQNVDTTLTRVERLAFNGTNFGFSSDFTSTNFGFSSDTRSSNFSFSTNTRSGNFSFSSNTTSSNFGFSTNGTNNGFSTNGTNNGFSTNGTNNGFSSNTTSSNFSFTSFSRTNNFSFSSNTTSNNFSFSTNRLSVGSYSSATWFATRS